MYQCFMVIFQMIFEFYLGHHIKGTCKCNNHLPKIQNIVEIVLFFTGKLSVETT